MVLLLIYSNILFKQICMACIKIVGIWWSRPLLFTTPLSSLSHCSRNSQQIFIFCPTIHTVFFLGINLKDHGKRQGKRVI
ncbi:hypothetical protein EDB85DRAFT_1949575 [Lactarius pseudohatsudake]|nr:hypothetical protein EDB85DRAFT_1949575 [Lactarius pseudohatsudake]